MTNSKETVRVHRHSRSTLNAALMVFITTLVYLVFSAPGTALTIFEFIKENNRENKEKVIEWVRLIVHTSNMLIVIHCSD